MSKRVLLGLLLGLAFLMSPVRAMETVLLADFETDADKHFENEFEKIVPEHAKGGKNALKVTHKGEGYPGVRFDDGAQLRIFHDNYEKTPLFTMDIFNPQDFPVNMGASAGDNLSKDYGSRYNEDGLIAPPGWSKLQINLTGLRCSDPQKRPVNVKQLAFFVIFLHPHNKKEPLLLYIDNIRLEADRLPKFDGLHAFDFGPSTSPVFPGFQAVSEKTLYQAGGFGWKGPNPAWTRQTGNPDDLGGDYSAGNAFLADVPAGAYEVHMCIDAFQQWHTPQMFTQRTVTINGKVVLDEKLTGAEFLKQRYLRFEDDEDTPGEDLWEKRIKVSTPIRAFETEVGADGHLEVQVHGGGSSGDLICFLVAFPKAKAAEGHKFLDELDKVRKEAFNNRVVLKLPKAENPAPKPSADDEKRGYVVFVRHTSQNINATSTPSDAERAAGLTLSACPGEREAAQLGLFPLRKVDGLKVSISDLSGPGGGKVPAASVQIHKLRNFWAREGGMFGMDLTARFLQPFDALDLAPGLTRALWLTFKVPDGIPAGEYKGQVTLEAGGVQASIPVTLTVNGFTLDKIDDMTVSCTGTTAGHWRGWYPEFEARWWQVAEDVIRDQAEHGLNALTGGPGFTLKAIKDGKAEIDFTDADRWMELAVKYGLTLRGDAYQGFDLNVGFNQSYQPDGPQKNDAAAQAAFGVKYDELLRIAYAEVERHAKEKNWPPRNFYLLDEPRPENRNIESALEYTKQHVKAAPNTKFSGYYSPGDGRDAYFPVMPVTVAHHTAASLKMCVDAGKEAWNYSGGGARYDIGRWCYVLKQKGLKGFLRNGYQYVNSDPYYDFSDVEASWAQVYPSKRGITASIDWERTAQGINDLRYLVTLEHRIKAAKAGGAKAAEVAAAESFLAETLKGITVEDESTADLKPEAWTAFRAALAKHITALGGK